MDNYPNRSPFSIPKFLYKALNECIPTLLYGINERVKCKFEPDDVFLGHPSFPYREGFKGVVEQSLEQKNRPRIFALITPLHCNLNIRVPHLNRDFLDAVDRMIPRVDKVFSIMGKYWWDTWDTSPYAHWKEKMIRLDMAIDVSCFPRVKHRFNRPGKRGYLYIGPNNELKGTDFFQLLMNNIGDFPRGWIGSGPEINGVNKISESRWLTPQFMKEVADEFDFFISPSRADANPTTILEAMAWGFPVICTKQSGYYKTPYREALFLDDEEKSLEVLRSLQFVPEEYLIEMANTARKVVETEYTWSKFTDTVLGGLGLL